jgi:hypothetical protein
LKTVVEPYHSSNKTETGFNQLFTLLTSIFASAMPAQNRLFPRDFTPMHVKYRRH